MGSIHQKVRMRTKERVSTNKKERKRMNVQEITNVKEGTGQK